jgi:protein gp37
MGEDSQITWCHHTFNPWWGCTEVSPGCDHCYARTWAHRHGLEWGDLDDDGNPIGRRFFSDAHWRAPLTWDRRAAKLGERHRVFCASMGDVFEMRDSLAPARRRLWDLIKATPSLDWLLLTKRPENAARVLPWMVEPGPRWPNVWLGVTTENEEWAWRRLSIARRIPAVVHFASYEPALGPVDFTRLSGLDEVGDRLTFNAFTFGPAIYGLDWIVAGDESGHGRRPASADWFRAVRDQVERHGASYHFKQWAGAETPGIAGERKGRDGKIHLPFLDGRRWADFPEVDRG